MAKMSAHETTPGQAFSTAALMLLTMLNPVILAFPGAPSSLTTPGWSSSKTDPSHPWKIFNQQTYYILITLLISVVRTKLIIMKNLHLQSSRGNEVEWVWHQHVRQRPRLVLPHPAQCWIRRGMIHRKTWGRAELGKL